jgi:PD-(D/E)XK nuclease superfamily
MGAAWRVVDNSILAATAKCHTYVYVRYGLGLNTRSESLALSAGSAIHLGLAEWMGGASVKRAVSVMATDYEEAVSRHLRKTERDQLGADDRRFEPEWVEAIFQQYLDHFEGQFPFKVIEVGRIEAPVSADFQQITTLTRRPVLYVARLDAIVRRWEAGGQWSMDHKSTRKATEWWVEKEKISSQFSGQLWLGKRQEREFQGVVLNVIELPEPHRSERECPEHHVSYQECSVRHAGSTFVYVQRSEAEMVAWEMSARRLVNQYDRLQAKADVEGITGVTSVSMQGRFNQGCVFCEFREWCRLGRNTSKAAVRATFIDDPWDPLKPQGT